MTWSKNYYSIGDFYRQKFGFKVQKIPVTLAESCPNREGIRGMETCVFCDPWGSAAYPEGIGSTISEQFQNKGRQLSLRYKTPHLMAYFQTYTTTFLGMGKLRAAFDAALAHEGVVGITLGTRPDCLSQALLELLAEYSLKTFVSVELGVQSFVDERLKFLKRGHDSQATEKAIGKLQTLSKIHLSCHLMFGLPGETDQEIIDTAKRVNGFKFQSVKLHNLHVLKSTGLEKEFLEGRFNPVSLEEYSRKVGIFLDHLSPEIAVHRLAALSSHWDQLVAPDWNRYKQKVSQKIMDDMVKLGIFQGRSFSSQPSVGC